MLSFQKLHITGLTSKTLLTRTLSTHRLILFIVTDWCSESVYEYHNLFTYRPCHSNKSLENACAWGIGSCVMSLQLMTPQERHSQVLITKAQDCWGSRFFGTMYLWFYSTKYLWFFGTNKYLWFFSTKHLWSFSTKYFCTCDSLAPSTWGSSAPSTCVLVVLWHQVLGVLQHQVLVYL